MEKKLWERKIYSLKKEFEETRPNSKKEKSYQIKMTVLQGFNDYCEPYKWIGGKYNGVYNEKIHQIPFLEIITNSFSQEPEIKLCAIKTLRQNAKNIDPNKMNIFFASIMDLMDTDKHSTAVVAETCLLIKEIAEYFEPRKIFQFGNLLVNVSGYTDSNDSQYFDVAPTILTNSLEAYEIVGKCIDHPEYEKLATQMINIVSDIIDQKMDIKIRASAYRAFFTIKKVFSIYNMSYLDFTR